MGRPPKASTARIQYKGVWVSLYRNTRNTWEASFTVPGHKRDKASGSTQAKCQESAQEKISKLLGSEERAFRSDEEGARSLLHDHGVTLTESARYWLSQHAKPLKKATVKELRQIWLEHRENHKGGGRYHHARSLRSRSLHLENKFGDAQISSISVSELTTWQDELELQYEPRTVRNIHDAAKDLWRFGRKRGYLNPERISAMEQVDRPIAGQGKREIYTPEEMQRLLNAAWSTKSRGAAALAIGAFGFIRSEELYGHDPDEPLEHRLAWEDFRWKENFIYIRPEVSKTKTSRHAGLPQNLKKMLFPLRGTGPVYPFPRMDVAYLKIANEAGLRWKHNALRHSCITYAMLTAPNATDVANKAGNSVAIIESNYRNRGATISQAKKWQSLKPKVKWGSGKHKEH